MSIACVGSGLTVGEVARVRRAPSDEALIKEIAKGNQAALRTLADRHQTRVYRFALRFVGDASHAEDVVSETFFAVWQQAAGFQNRSAVGTWLLGIARYRALSMRDRLRETAEPLDDEIASNLPDPAHGTGRRAGARQSRHLRARVPAARCRPSRRRSSISCTCTRSRCARPR